MSEAGRLPKPNIPFKNGGSIRAVRHGKQAFVFSTIVAIAYRAFYWQKYDKLYADYYKTYDMDKLYQQWKTDGTYKCFEDGQPKHF